MVVVEKDSVWCYNKVAIDSSDSEMVEGGGR